MNFIRTGNEEKNGDKTFINLDKVGFIDKNKEKYFLYQGFSHTSSRRILEKGELGYEELKKILGDN